MGNAPIGVDANPTPAGALRTASVGRGDLTPPSWTRQPAPVPIVGGGLRPAPPGMAAFGTDPVGSGTLPSPRRGGPVCPPGYVILPGPAHGPTHRLAPTESLAAAIDPENLGGDRAPPLPSGSGPPCRGRAPPRRGRLRFAPIPLVPERFPSLRRGGPVCAPGHALRPGSAHGPTHRSAPTESLAAAIDPRKPGGGRAPPLPSDRGAQQYLWHDLRRVGEAPMPKSPLFSIPSF